MKKYQIFTIIFIVLVLVFSSCQREWRPGMPLAKENVIIGVIHISDPFNETSGYSFSHQTGIDEMIANLNLAENQVIYRIHVDYSDPMNIENVMRELIARGANIIIATSWGYMDACEKLAAEYPAVIFAHASGYKNNDTNFTNYFGRVYQARYLSGIIAGAKTQNNLIGFVAAWGTENSEVTGGINAFAMGVERVNPDARILVSITNSWFDPMGETMAARDLINSGVDIIAMHVDTANPQIEAERAGIWGIGYNTDKSIDAPDAVLTSVLWNWGAYYTFLVQSVIDGTFTTTPWYGSLSDGIVELTPPNENIVWDPEIISLLNEERRRIESGAFDIFHDIMETNDGRFIGRQGERLSDSEIQFGINWYYRTVSEL